MDEYNIGAKLRRARQKKKMSLKTLAQAIGCSTSLISLIENRKISPPIRTLSSIAKALNMSIADLFEEDEELVAVEITRNSDRRFRRDKSALGDPWKSVGTQPSSLIRNKKLKSSFIRFPKGCSNYLKYRYSEESVIYVINGKAELLLGKELIPLEEGDSVYFETTTAHGFRSRDDSEVLILEVDTAA